MWGGGEEKGQKGQASKMEDVRSYAEHCNPTNKNNGSKEHWVPNKPGFFTDAKLPFSIGPSNWLLTAALTILFDKKNSQVI